MENFSKIEEGRKGSCEGFIASFLKKCAIFTVTQIPLKVRERPVIITHLNFMSGLRTFKITRVWRKLSKLHSFWNQNWKVNFSQDENPRNSHMQSISKLLDGVRTAVRRGNLNEALDYAELAWKISLTIPPDQADVAREEIYQGIAYALYALGNIPEALLPLESAIRILSDLGDPYEVELLHTRELWNLEISNWALNVEDTPSKIWDFRLQYITDQSLAIAPSMKNWLLGNPPNLVQSATS